MFGIETRRQSVVGSRSWSSNTSLQSVSHQQRWRRRYVVILFGVSQGSVLLFFSSVLLTRFRSYVSFFHASCLSLLCWRNLCISMQINWMDIRKEMDRDTGWTSKALGTKDSQALNAVCGVGKENRAYLGRRPVIQDVYRLWPGSTCKV